MLNDVNEAQWRKNGMVEVGEGKVVGDVKKKLKIIIIIIVIELRIMEC